MNQHGGPRYDDHHGDRTGRAAQRCGVVSILQLLDSGAFTAERIKAIRDAIAAPLSS